LNQIIYIWIFALALCSCSGPTDKAADNSSVASASDNKLSLRKLEKLFVVGDFDGDGNQDTLSQHNFSGLTNSEMEFSPDPSLYEMDTVIKWFYEQKADVYLTLNINNQDTLHVGTAQGLYCLINIGDNNSDNQDEIALVVHYLDNSRVNSCQIYALCNGKWVLLKQFGVHEDAFDFTSAKAPIFSEIVNYLEKHNGKWVYQDYSEDGYDEQKDVGNMLPLKLESCD